MKRGVLLGLGEGPIKWVPCPNPAGTPSVRRHACWLILAHHVCFLQPTLLWAAKVRVSVSDAGPMVPEGLGHWIPRGLLVQAQLDSPFHGQSTKGNLYTYIHNKTGLASQPMLLAIPQPMSKNVLDIVPKIKTYMNISNKNDKQWSLKVGFNYC